MLRSIGSDPSTVPPRTGTIHGPALWGARRGDLLALVGLLAVVCASLADGLLAEVVAAETDTAIFYYPLARWASAALGRGELPLWLPNIFGGYPIMAEGEVGLASPLVLAALLALPAESGLVWLRVVHLAIGAGGCYALARVWRLPVLASALAGVVFGLGSFLQAQIHHENIVRTAVWLPLVLALVERALRSGGRRRARAALLAAAALGMAGLGLHPQILAIDLVALGAYVVVRGLMRPAEVAPRARSGPVASLGLMVGVALLGLALAAVQLLPLAELARLSARGAGLSYSEATAYSFVPYGLAQLAFPFFFFDERGRSWGFWNTWETALYVGLVPLVLASIALVLVRSRQVLGWSILAAGSFGLALGQYNPLHFYDLFWLLPGAGGLRVPARFNLVTVLALAMLAAHGLAWLQARAAGRAERGMAGLLLVSLGLPTVLAMVVLGLHQALLRDPALPGAVLQFQYAALGREEAALLATDGVYRGLLWSTNPANPRLVGGLLGLFGLAVCLLVWQGGRWARVRNWSFWPGLLLLGTVADLMLFSWGMHPRRPLAELRAVDPAIAAIGQARAEPSDEYTYSRMLLSPDVPKHRALRANRLVPAGVDDVDGYSSLPLGAQREYVRLVRQGDDRLLDLFNVRYLVEPVNPTQHPERRAELEARHGRLDYRAGRPKGGEPSRFRELYRDRELVVLENRSALPRALLVPSVRRVASLDEALRGVRRRFDPTREAIVVGQAGAEPSAPHGAAAPEAQVNSGAARIVRYDPNRVSLEVTASWDGYLVLLDSYYPGWEARVDGEQQAILPANVLFRAVPVPEGRHLVEFEFRPTSLKLGLAISGLALAGVVAGLAWTAVRRRRADLD